MADTDLSAWLPTVPAAAEIGCSPRTLERRAAEWHIEKRLRPQAGSPAVAVYNPDDVARIAVERHPAPAPFVLPAVSTHQPTNGARGSHPGPLEALARMPSGDDPIRQLAAAFRAFLLSPPSAPAPATVAEMALTDAEVAARYVTLAQASAIKGLPQGDLRRLVEAGELPHRRTGRGGIRIRRKDLEAL